MTGIKHGGNLFLHPSLRFGARESCCILMSSGRNTLACTAISLIQVKHVDSPLADAVSNSLAFRTGAMFYVG